MAPEAIGPSFMPPLPPVAPAVRLKDDRGKAKGLGLRCAAAKFLGAWDAGMDTSTESLVFAPPPPFSPSMGEGVFPRILRLADAFASASVERLVHSTHL
jgi:hypothetical protein